MNNLSRVERAAWRFRVIELCYLWTRDSCLSAEDVVQYMSERLLPFDQPEPIFSDQERLRAVKDALIQIDGVLK